MKQIHRLFVITLLTAFAGSITNATTYYVNASTGNNGNNGTSSGTAFKTITYALSVAADGDVVNVAAGTYNSALGELFPLEMVSGVTLTGTAGALQTIIDASADSNRVFNCDGSSATTIIQGFTITGGYVTNYSTAGAQSKGGGLYIDNGSQVIIQNNIITRDTVRGYDFFQVSGGLNGGTCYGGGIHVQNGTPTIRNNVISYNVAIAGGGRDFRGGFGGFPSAGGNAYGGGIYAGFAGAGTIIVNNTFYGNKVIGGLGGSTNNGVDPGGNGGDASAAGVNVGSNTVATNNIFSNNEAIEGTRGGGNGGSDGASTNGAIEGFAGGNLSYNLYYNNAADTDPNGATLGSNNITGSDPLFVGTSNFHFSSTSSPAYHAGTSTNAPTTDLDGSSRSLTTPSIGAYEGLDPLPVELVSFNASPNQSGVELKWKTATEVNNYGFEIQRSEVRGQMSVNYGHSEPRRGEESSTWTKIGFVEGNGTSNTVNEYSFTDTKLKSGTYSYRLKQIDNDGKFEYSSQVEVTVGKVPKKFSLEQNYPNPFNPSTTIGFTVQSAGLTSLKIYDIIGREVATLVNEYLEPGTHHQRRFDASELSNGIYFYRLQSGSFSAMNRMILLK